MTSGETLASGETSVVMPDSEPTAEKVQESLETMLSKKNLVRDQFLAGNMNPQMYIPIAILLQHEKLKEIGATIETVIVAATNSTRLAIDEAKTMVRPMLKSKRNIVIIRDIPDGTTEEEVRHIFASSPYSEKVSSVKAEVNNTWFVKFDLDDGTQDVVLWLRSQKFKGQSINAAIKSEHFLRSFYPVDMSSGPPPGLPDATNAMLSGSMGQFGFDNGKGKGMMPIQPMHMQMPCSQQPPGFWQPWGARPEPLPIVLPTTGPPVPVSSTDSEVKGKDGGGWSWDKGSKGKNKDAKGKGKGGSSKGKHQAKSGYEKTDQENIASRKGKASQKKTREGGPATIEMSGPTQPKLLPPATYNRDYNKYTRSKFEEVAKSISVEGLEKTNTLIQLEADAPVFLESACLELAK